MKPWQSWGLSFRVAATKKKWMSLVSSFLILPVCLVKECDCHIFCFCFIPIWTIEYSDPQSAWWPAPTSFISSSSSLSLTSTYHQSLPPWILQSSSPATLSASPITQPHHRCKHQLSFCLSRRPLGGQWAFLRCVMYRVSLFGRSSTAEYSLVQEAMAREKERSSRNTVTSACFATGIFASECGGT